MKVSQTRGVKLSKCLFVVLAACMIMFSGCSDDDDTNDDEEEVMMLGGSTPQGLSYDVYTSSIVITGYYGSKMDVVIPSTIEGKPVTRILEGAFERRNITSVRIPSSMEKIYDKAFYQCRRLVSVNMAGCTALKTIGNDAFSVTALESIDLSGCTALETIGIGAFSATALTTVRLPDSVTHICAWAFSLCVDLATLNVPVSLDNIADDAFQHCPSLPSATQAALRAAGYTGSF